MNDLASSLFRAILSIFILMTMGWGLRRIGLVGARGTDLLGRAVILGFFPVLVFHRLASATDPAVAFAGWAIHVWAVVTLLGGGLVGWLWHRVMRAGDAPRTFLFIVAMPNWIFLPLAVAGPLWGDEAVRLIILFNIPTQLMMWTLGILLLQGTLRNAHALKYMVINPGLIASVAGLLSAYGVLPVTLREGGAGLSLAALNGPLHLIGNLTIPLSLIALGLQLGDPAPARPDGQRTVALVIIGRLLIAPLVLIAAVIGVEAAGFAMAPTLRWVVYLIVAMPVAVSVPLFVQLFGGDLYLATRSVLMSTLAGLVTAPLLVLLALVVERALGMAP
jgi:predicted permease